MFGIYSDLGQQPGLTQSVHFPFVFTSPNSPNTGRHQNPCCWGHHGHFVAQFKSGLIPKQDIITNEGRTG